MGRLAAGREGTVRELLEPSLARRLVGFVVEPEIGELVWVVAGQIDNPCAVAHFGAEDLEGTIERLLPEVGVEFQVTEVIGGFEEVPMAGHGADDFPELVVHRFFGEGIGRGELDAVADEQTGEGGEGGGFEGFHGLHELLEDLVAEPRGPTDEEGRLGGLGAVRRGRVSLAFHRCSGKQLS